MAKSTKKTKRVLDARPDSLDFRDQMYTASLYEVPTKIDLKEYTSWKVPILDQGKEGACTGYGLATVAHYLLRRRKIIPDQRSVSPKMFYEMAKRYDEWPGEDYSGSSARGAMKGWYKHGVCGEDCYKATGKLNDAITADALQRPLGAYYRVNHKDLVAMHSAMAEVGILYATSIVHGGWDNAGKDGIIKYEEKPLGGHAFAIVAYDHDGFWIQNSWGKDWGKNGFGHISYDDWLANGTDTWVARLGAPVNLYKSASISTSHSASAGNTKTYSFADLRPHIISLGNNGELKPGGDFGTSEDEVHSLFKEDFPRITKGWKKKRILLYAHGGLVSEDSAVQRLADYRATLLQSEVYPISFIWHSDMWSTITNVLEDAFHRRRPEGFLDNAKDFMLDRLDDALEPIARALTGKLQWTEMKQNALLATGSRNGGALLALKHIADLAKEYKDDFEIHIVGHSAGSIFHAPIIELLTTKGAITSGALNGMTGLGLKIESCTLWAPACTTELFKRSYVPSISNKTIKRFALFALTDEAEQDDNCAHVYNKSLLYLVSNSFEDKARIPLFRDGTPILGMQKFIMEDKEILDLFNNKNCELVLSPNTIEKGSIYSSTSHSHGDFDDDNATVNATLGRILNKTEQQSQFSFKSSASSLKDHRSSLSRPRLG